MSRARVLVVDDEPVARTGMCALLARDPTVEVVGECGSGAAAVKAIGELGPDIVFLDIQMPDMSGFDVLSTLSPGDPPVVVFVTAHDRYTLQAFEAHALDYLLKPFTDERFDRALGHAREQLEQRQALSFRTRLEALIADGRSNFPDLERPGIPQVETGSRRYLRRLAVGDRDEVRFIDVGAVHWIEADAYRVRVHCGRETVTLRGNIGSFERQLDPERFVRIHRSTLVNLAYVRALRTLFHGQVMVLMADGTELKTSRGQRSRLVSLLQHRG